MSQSKPIHWQNALTIVSVAILVGTELVSLTWAAGWALGGLFQLPPVISAGVEVIGYFFSRISRVERILAGLAGALFILPGSTTSSAAIAIALVLFGWNFITSRRLARG